MTEHTVNGKPVNISPEQARRIKAIRDVRTLLDPFTAHDRLAIALMVATKTTEELLVLNPGAKRGKLVKAAQEDFARMLQRHVTFNPEALGSGPSSPIPESHPVAQTEPDPGEEE